ncbi:MAG TPA: TetR/AcrR family transcriptional regulator [Terriglobales bacterium]|nr:TetR/AcrR family transcriptional regulator [Terriglobales bacterium]
MDNVVANIPLPRGRVLNGEASTRNKILDAAEALFARRGYSGVGMREVADAVGIGKSSLFHHFTSKVQLHAAVAGRILDIFDRRLTAALEIPGDAVARFDHWLETLIDTLVEYPTSARLLLRSLFEDDELTGTSEEERHVDATLHHLVATLAELLQRGMAAGAFRKASIPHTLQSLIGLTVYHFASGEFGDELIGKSVFSPEAVKRRKQEVRDFLHLGLVSGAAVRPRPVK